MFKVYNFIFCQTKQYGFKINSVECGFNCLLMRFLSNTNCRSFERKAIALIVLFFYLVAVVAVFEYKV